MKTNHCWGFALDRPEGKSIGELIASGRPLLYDGAIGTELYNMGIFINKCFEEVNLTAPHTVKRLHESYLEAGAEIICTNSWGANKFKLREFNLGDQVVAINHAAARIAREAAGRGALVAGSIGPLGIRIEPWGPTSLSEAREAFRQQAQALLDGGVDFITLETFSDISVLEQAVKGVRDASTDTVIFAHVVINTDYNMPLGTPLAWAVRQLDDWPVEVIGLNCSVGPAPMYSAIEKIRAISQKPLSLLPNAGLPKLVDGRQIYLSTPDYLAKFTKDFLQKGVQFVGGCCGTTPAHIKAMANSFRHFRAMHRDPLAGEEATLGAAEGKERAGTTHAARPTPHSPAAKSSWAAMLQAGRKVYSVELLPPTGLGIHKLIEKARFLRENGVNAINIPDGPRASARMSAILTAVMVEQQAGIESILHYACRDRNLLSMQSDMIGAHAIGLRNMLLVTGDPPKMGSYPNATGVFDVDAIGLTNMVTRLNQGSDLGGRDLGEPTMISTGVASNPVARDLEHELKRFRYKVEAGAEWTITQPVFSKEPLMRFLDHIHRNGLAIPVVVGIWPLVSFRNALFMNNEVPGVEIPDAVMERMSKFTDPDDMKKAGVEIAQEIIGEILQDVAGIQMSAPFGNASLALTALQLNQS